MYTRVFVVTLVAFFVQLGQYSAAQSFEPSPATELSQFDNDGLGSGFDTTQDALDISSAQQADTVSMSLFETSLSSSPADIARQSGAQQRVVYNALQFVALGLLLLVGVVAGTMIYFKSHADLFGSPMERRRDDW